MAHWKRRRQEGLHNAPLAHLLLMVRCFAASETSSEEREREENGRAEEQLGLRVRADSQILSPSSPLIYFPAPAHFTPLRRRAPPGHKLQCAPGPSARTRELLLLGPLPRLGGPLRCDDLLRLSALCRSRRQRAADHCVGSHHSRLPPARLSAWCRLPRANHD